MEIQQNITEVNRTISPDRRIEYLVLHYVGAVSSAYNNTVYFKRQNRGASAHYFVDEHSIWQCVSDQDTVWHCGAENGVYRHPRCRNGNSIGIELCCKRDSLKGWFFEEQTVRQAVWLTAELAEGYGIDPEHIIRHYDVTGKICPEPWVREEKAWLAFLQEVKGMMTAVPAWQQEAFEQLVLDKVILSPEYWQSNLGETVSRGELMALLWAVYQRAKGAQAYGDQ